MKGDFSRFTFAPEKHFRRVLMQQGRLLLDADWNEQAAILLDNLQRLTHHLIGEGAGPASDLGFGIAKLDNLVGLDKDFRIEPGFYYVEGILVELRDDPAGTKMSYTKQAGSKNDLPALPLLVYLDVWEHHITSVEDDSIREVALGDADTATRTEVVWRVKVDSSNVPATRAALDLNAWQQRKEKWQPTQGGRLKARVGNAKSTKDGTPSIVSPASRYRGQENQLYRVEVHTGTVDGDPATFKWSRDNGSVVFPIVRSQDPNTVVVRGLGRDGRSTLKVGNWVEIVDDDMVLRDDVPPLRRVKEVDFDRLAVTLEGGANGGTLRSYSDEPADKALHPLMRRWDFTAAGLEPGNGIPAVPGQWLKIENGIEISFEENGSYRSGDYWLIPARVATGDIEWPRTKDGPQPLGPHGVLHHYAPLAIITAPGAPPIDLRMKIKETTEFATL